MSLINPSKSITAISPDSILPSLITKSAYLFLKLSTSLSISSFVTLTVSFLTPNSLYFLILISGLVVITNLITAFSSSTSTISILGSIIGSSLLSLRTFSYNLPISALIAE